MGRNGAGDLIVRIQLQFRGDFAPLSAESRHGAWADQFNELIGPNDETTLGIHLPDKTQRMTAFRQGFGARDRRLRVAEAHESRRGVRHLPRQDRFGRPVAICGSLTPHGVLRQTRWRSDLGRRL